MVFSPLSCKMWRGVGTRNNNWQEGWKYTVAGPRLRLKNLYETCTVESVPVGCDILVFLKCGG